MIFTILAVGVGYHGLIVVSSRITKFSIEEINTKENGKTINFHSKFEKTILLHIYI